MDNKCSSSAQEIKAWVTKLKYEKCFSIIDPNMTKF